MPKITEMYAFITQDETPDDEGVLAAKIGDNWMPLVGADISRIDSVRPIAQKVAKQLGKKVTLVKFTQRSEIETINSSGKPAGHYCHICNDYFGLPFRTHSYLKHSE